MAYYRLPDEIKAAHLGLVIESPSGGAWVDLRPAAHRPDLSLRLHRPAFERQMNRWTTQLVPPELMGSHIASGISHTTGRWHTLNFRAATAVFGHRDRMGSAKATPADNRIRVGIAFHKQYRELLLGGDLVRATSRPDDVQPRRDRPPDRSRATYSFAEVSRPGVVLRGRVRFPGLDPVRRYRVTPLMLEHPPLAEPPRWWEFAATWSTSWRTWPPIVRLG
ncbi:MAG: alpha-galactosidase [Micropruina sp.]|nr:alpha-galactosidase [Micropruina sp.]